MKYIYIILLLCFASCSSNAIKESNSADNPVKDSESEEFDNSYAVDKINIEVKSVEDDTSMKIESAVWTLGDASFTSTRYLKEDQLVKLFWRSNSAYGEELFKIYYGENNDPIFIWNRSIKRLCDKDMNVCFASYMNYYDHGELLMSQQRKATHAPDIKPDYDSVPLSSDPEQDDVVKSKDNANLEMISKELKSIEFHPSQRYRGEYKYFADAAIFRDCSTGTIYPIPSYDLEVAYLKYAQPESYIGLIIIGNIEIHPNMEGNPVETIILKEIVNFSPRLSCN